MIGTTLPAWAAWSPAAGDLPWSVGIEEEVMLIDRRDWSLASRVDDVLRAATPALSPHLAQETHGSAVEIATAPHPDVASATAELGGLRAALRETLEPLGLAPAAAGTHPFATWEDVHVSAGERQQLVHRSMRELARREPTFALHVHVAVPDPDVAVRAMNRMRAHIPLLLALSANSPFWQGRDSGLTSARTPLFQAFPRAGLPRAFDSYEELIGAIDVLIRSGAVPEASFVWWDVRLQPRYGTLEVRVMDSQATCEHTAALAALVQALVRLECEESGLASPALIDAPEVLDENRFLAARDGIDARLIDPEAGNLVSVHDLIEDLLAAAAPVCDDLGNGFAPAAIAELMGSPGHAHQRGIAGGPGGLPAVVRDLVARF